MTIAPFYLSRCEVTQAEWRAVATGLPRVLRPLDPEPSAFHGDDLPVEQVSWEDAMEFCERLSRKTRQAYHLPSEAQWEWAARAGTTTTRYFGETDKGQADYSWFNVTYTPNPKKESQGRGRKSESREIGFSFQHEP